MTRLRLAYIISFIFFIISAFSAYPQKKRSDLEREKQENQKKIAETNRILEETRNKKTATIGQLNVLSQQIKVKNQQINTYEKEIRILNGEIGQIEASIENLSNYRAALKKEYAKMIYNTAKANDTYSNIIFLFSSKTFNQLIMRIKYFKYYSQARQKQAKELEKVTDVLISKRVALYNKKREREGVLLTIRQENKNLGNLKSEQETR